MMMIIGTIKAGVSRNFIISFNHVGQFFSVSLITSNIRTDDEQYKLLKKEKQIVL